LRKESLWPHLDSLLDQIIRHVRASGRPPDLIHGHYADAGYVGAQLSKLLGVPFLFTGHSLGRVKRARLLEQGGEEQALEQRYHFKRRIEAEETATETAALVITSTHQEVHEQYEFYDHYQPDRMQVIPPGVDVSRFSPPPLGWRRPPIAAKVNRFLRAPEKPMILALARPDERKNFSGLIEAYAKTPGLRATANLVLIVGNREVIGEMPAGARRVLTEILLLIDRYDLYGSVAYPKQHSPDDVPDLFRLAAKSRGVFVNPALTEPFGLTLLEAAASGLPVVATNDGGPQDILATCENGVLIDPLDSSTMGLTIRGALASRKRWGRWSKNGISGVHKGFSWTSHARRYVREAEGVLEGVRPTPAPAGRSRILGIDRLLITDIDDTLIGNDEALEALLARLKDAEPHIGFGIATGRSIDRALQILEERGIPTPDVLITSSGAQLHYGPDLIRDRSWERQIGYRWDPEGLEELLSVIPGLDPAEDGDTTLRLRYVLDPSRAPPPEDLQRALRKLGFHVTTILDRGVHLDILPVRASPGLAIRFFCFKWDLPPERLLVVGDSGNDSDMLSGDALGVVVSNHTPELESLRGASRIHFALGDHAWGILEGIERYDFFDNIQIPEDGPEDEQREARLGEEVA
jgi:sucrose-phosphate synthase